MQLKAMITVIDAVKGVANNRSRMMSQCLEMLRVTTPLHPSRPPAPPTLRPPPRATVELTGARWPALIRCVERPGEQLGQEL